jgi:sugar lactone lactonase YvrE
MANQPTVLMTGIAFGECPRWHDGRLWFSDWLTHEIIAMTPDGRSEVAVRLPYDGFPFSFDWLPDGRMLIVSNSYQPCCGWRQTARFRSTRSCRTAGTRSWLTLVATPTSTVSASR